MIKKISKKGNIYKKFTKKFRLENFFAFFFFEFFFLFSLPFFLLSLSLSFSLVLFSIWLFPLHLFPFCSFSFSSLSTSFSYVLFFFSFCSLYPFLFCVLFLFLLLHPFPMCSSLLLLFSLSLSPPLSYLSRIAITNLAHGTLSLNGNTFGRLPIRRSQLTCLTLVTFWSVDTTARRGIAHLKKEIWPLLEKFGREF